MENFQWKSAQAIQDCEIYRVILLHLALKKPALKIHKKESVDGRNVTLNCVTAMIQNQFSTLKMNAGRADQPVFRLYNEV